VTNASTPAHLDPRWEAFMNATELLTGPGGPFEVVQQDVRGETMGVLRNRPLSLREVLVNSFEFGDKESMIFDDGRRVTFAGFEADVASTAAWLQREHGIGHGDRVAICGANSYGWIVTFWACLSMGATTVAMNGWWTEPEMRHAIDLSEPKLLMFDARRAERLSPDVDIPRRDLDVDLAEMLAYAPEAAIPANHIDEDDPAILIFTSGTTGRPKAAVLSHRSVIHYSSLSNFLGARGMVLAGVTPGAGPSPIRLAVFPLFHVSGLGATVNGLHTGSTGAWFTARFDADTVIPFIIENKVNLITGTGTHILRLLDSPLCAQIPPQQVMSVGMGGSATTPEIMRRLAVRFPHLDHTMASGYGSTETGSLISYAPNWMLELAPECIGPALPTVQVRITDDEGNEVPEGGEGNIAVRSPLLMNEYWRHPAANAESFFPGRWFNTGDFGRMEGGCLYIASRKRDLILRGGENIYPFEIENCIEELPGVIETAVIGVDHDILGQEVKAIIVVAEDSAITDLEVHDHCKASLSSYKVPAYIELRTARLPRNPSGKILKHVLADGGEAGFVED
jgi:acyl-CoA synthetase (AMP-forming)/AMP-acid ligase II